MSDAADDARHHVSPAAQNDHTFSPTAVNRLLLLLVLALAAFLRLYALDASSLWNDEGTTWALMAQSYSEIAQKAAADIHPPGYYWLLKLWTTPFEASAWTMRSLSALLGILLVFIVYRIGLYLDSAHKAIRLTGLLAALLAALNPFLVYYSQEARMYALLATLAAGLFWSLFALVDRESSGGSPSGPLIWYVGCGVAGLWTHYSFPIVLAASGISYLIHLFRQRKNTADGDQANDGEQISIRRRLTLFVLANIAILFLYLPWLQIAVERVLNWPKGGDWTSAQDGIAILFQTLVMGPIRTAPDLTWPWLILALILPLIGLWAVRHSFAALALGSWFAAPLLLMLGLGLITDAFLKFLLIAVPAWCLLVAALPLCCAKGRHVLQAALAIAAFALAIVVLPGYYADTNARDNYAGVAQMLEEVGDPASDIVIINAPGQQDVWAYYDPGLPTLALPETRPPDQLQTVQTLEQATKNISRAYGLFWATDESDPAGYVESWLDENAYKSSDTWQGNLRFVTYTFTEALDCVELEPQRFGDRITLVSYCKPDAQYAVQPGGTAPVSLRWQTDRPVEQRYRVSVQLLDEFDQVIAQHDEDPAGGSRPTMTWTFDQTIVDNHGLTIPDDAEPGRYRLIVALYDPETGKRLPVGASDYLSLGQIDIEHAGN